MRETTYELPGLNNPKTVRSGLLITSVRVLATPGHDVITVWNRGGCAGSLTVGEGDGQHIALRLLPQAIITVREAEA